MAGLGDYEIREGRDGNVGVYLRKYNVRCATFGPGSEALQDLLKELIWDAQDSPPTVGGMEDLNMEDDESVPFAPRKRTSIQLADKAENDRLRAKLASRQIDVDTFREGNQKLRAELADMKRTNWKVAHIKDLEAQLTERRDRVDDIDKELAEWKERHPYGEVDLDMAIDAESKYLRRRIDTLESAQIDYEMQCAAKDARIKEEFDKYCRNLTELAQVHKESCDAKDVRIAELKDDVVTLSYTATEKATALEAANARIAELEADKVRFQRQLEDFRTDARDERARAERADAERDAMREALELLVRRLDNIWTKSNLASVLLMADRHGIKYTGETWVEPLDKARAALAPPAGREG